MVITYVLERDLSKIRRQVYGILDYVGDLGGLAGAIFSIFSTLVLLFQWKTTINYTGNHLYLIREGEEKEDYKSNQDQKAKKED